MAAPSCTNRLVQVFQASKVIVALASVLSHVPIFEAQQTGGAVTCTAGTYELYEEAVIQCNFNKNLNTTKTNFNVVHYKYFSKSYSGTFVLLCNWKLQQDPQLACKVEEGYSFDYVVGNRLRLNVARVTSQHSGVYVCQLVPDDGSRLETCKLTVKWELPPTIHHTTDANKDLIVAAIVILCIFFLTFIGYIARRKIRKLILLALRNKNQTKLSIEEGTSNTRITLSDIIRSKLYEKDVLLGKSKAAKGEGIDTLSTEKHTVEIHTEQGKGKESQNNVGGENDTNNGKPQLQTKTSQPLSSNSPVHRPVTETVSDLDQHDITNERTTASGLQRHGVTSVRDTASDPQPHRVPSPGPTGATPMTSAKEVSEGKETSDSNLKDAELAAQGSQKITEISVKDTLPSKLGFGRKILNRLGI